GLGDGVPDGICLDTENAVWYGDVPNERCVRVREGGEVLQTIELDRGSAACALGGPGRRTLFMMATVWDGPEKHVRRAANRPGADRGRASTGRRLAGGSTGAGPSPRLTRWVVAHMPSCGGSTTWLCSAMGRQRNTQGRLCR